MAVLGLMLTLPDIRLAGGVGSSALAAATFSAESLSSLFLRLCWLSLLFDPALFELRTNSAAAPRRAAALEAEVEGEGEEEEERKGMAATEMDSRERNTRGTSGGVEEVAAAGEGQGESERVWGCV